MIFYIVTENESIPTVGKIFYYKLILRMDQYLLNIRTYDLWVFGENLYHIVEKKECVFN